MRGSDLDVQRMIAEGDQFVKNAEDELDRKILREDQLYFIENQVEAIDTFLADTEELQDDSPDLKGLRDKLREMKGKLEKKSMEFLAEQEGTDLPEESPPEETAAEFVVFGQDFVQLADEALAQEVDDIEKITVWEDPVTMINSFLADSEPFVPHHSDLAKIRAEVRSRKVELQKRIYDLENQWRAADMAAGGD